MDELIKIKTKFSEAYLIEKLKQAISGEWFGIFLSKSEQFEQKMMALNYTLHISMRENMKSILFVSKANNYKGWNRRNPFDICFKPSLSIPCILPLFSIVYNDFHNLTNGCYI